MDLFILKTDVEKFTSTTKKTLHLIFKHHYFRLDLFNADEVDVTTEFLYTTYVVSFFIIFTVYCYKNLMLS